MKALLMDRRVTVLLVVAPTQDALKMTMVFARGDIGERLVSVDARQVGIYNV